MVSKMEACSECSRSCMSLHRTKVDPYPIVSSFFKVIFGNHFSEILIMPPKFARTIMAMEGRSTYLEDPTGQKWEVNLSSVKGSLAFQKGWNEFSSDHGIELGDFLVFHYFKGSHFVVQIFGKSGCEKPMTFSNKNYQNKRAKLSTDSSPISLVDFSCKVSPAKESSNIYFDPKFDVDFSQKNDLLKMDGKLQEVRVDVSREWNANKRSRDINRTDFMLESCFMSNKITSYSTEDDRRDCLFDLSIFEMPEKKLDVTTIISLPKTQTDEVASLEAEKCQISKDIIEISDEVDCIELPNDIDSSVDDMPLNISPPLKTITLPHKYMFSAPAASCHEPPHDGRTNIVKQETKTSESAGFLQDNANFSASNDHKVKNNGFGWHSSSKIEDYAQRGIKMSPKSTNVCYSPAAQATQITCLIKHNSETFLELPRPLNVRDCNQDNVKLEQNLVLLRDPVRRLWPVIYHQKNGFRALTSGWKEFRKSNGIRPGDMCTFVVENTDKGVLRVQIVSKLSSE